jgi:hypothetical protein
MSNQPITNRPTVLEVKPGEWHTIDAGSAAPGQNVITSHRELTEAIREALTLCKALRTNVQTAVRQ